MQKRPLPDPSEDSISIKLPIPPAAVRKIRRYVDSFERMADLGAQVVELGTEAIGAAKDLGEDIGKLLEKRKRTRKI